jgi:hypothetical protein
MTATAAAVVAVVAGGDKHIGCNSDGGGHGQQSTKDGSRRNGGGDGNGNCYNEDDGKGNDGGDGNSGDGGIPSRQTIIS